tara:strand:- start:302 stop:538 length:237 start_codon:yes stop_codon:yes gene_type:complete
MRKNKATGTRGSWFATVARPDFPDPKTLPIGHFDWCENQNQRMIYHDKNLRSTNPKADSFVAAIKKDLEVVLHNKKAN